MKKAEHNYTKKSINFAKELRKNQTDFEINLWNALRNRNFMNLKFRRQVPIGNYIVDFACKEKRIILELDGSGHIEKEQVIHDDIRDDYLKSLGYKVIRIWNNELKDVDSILNTYIIISAFNKHTDTCYHFLSLVKRSLLSLSPWGEG